MMNSIGRSLRSILRISCFSLMLEGGVVVEEEVEGDFKASWTVIIVTVGC